MHLEQQLKYVWPYVTPRLPELQQPQAMQVHMPCSISPLICYWQGSPTQLRCRRTTCPCEYVRTTKHYRTSVASAIHVKALAAEVLMHCSDIWLVCTACVLLALSVCCVQGLSSQPDRGLLMHIRQAAKQCCPSSVKPCSNRSTSKTM